MNEHPDATTEALARLCEYHGIATSYLDIWGTRHAVDPAHLWALLGEFGVAPGQPDETAAARWAHPLPPVLAVGAGSPSFELALRLPLGTPSFAWRIEQEDGATAIGRAETSDLQELERAEFEGGTHARYRLPIAQALPPGYHRFRVDGQAGDTLLICAPHRAYRTPALDHGGRLWGLTLQLHGLRSPRNWGIGDFTDLTAFVERAAGEGAALVGLNPLHALFPHQPEHSSPYSPSSRAHLNVLYLDIEAIPEFPACEAAQRLVGSPAFESRLLALREAPLIDHAGVADAKFEVLDLLYRHFRQHAPNTAEPLAFAQFRADGGEALQQHALFEALQEHLHAADPQVWGWPAWPPAYRDPAGEAAAGFARQHADRIGFFAYLQWRATQQLDAVVQRCRALGMPIGLYLDLAVSVDRAGSDAWRHQQCFALGASVGAPPDEFNPNGQNWGLPPLRPDRLRASRYEAFIEVLRASMRGAGAIRIDHVMGLMRLFWIPAGGTAHRGAYVHYPIDEMLAIVALESERNQCLVIGEDLGTVADAMREAMQRFGVLSYRLMYFEQHADGSFKPPADYPHDALVAISTHDLATLAGWWAVHDLRLRRTLGLFPNEAVFEKQVLDRAQQRIHLLTAARQVADFAGDELAEALGGARLPASAVAAVHAFLASTPSRLMVMQLEDALGDIEQANMPGTTVGHPNWRRKYALDVDAMWQAETLPGLCRTLARHRPRGH